MGMMLSRKRKAQRAKVAEAKGKVEEAAEVVETPVEEAPAQEEVIAEGEETLPKKKKK